MARMRVLQVIPSVSAERGGPTEALVQLCRALAARGVEPWVLATRSDLDAAGEREVRRRLGCRLELVPTWGPSRVELAPAWPFRLARALRRVEVAHIHTVFTFPAATAPAVCRALGVPHVIAPSGMLDAACLGLRSPRIKRAAIAGWVRRNLMRAGAVQATSALEAGELGRLEPRAKIARVELGAWPEPARPARPVGRTLGTLGRLHPIKRIELLLDALARLPPPAELLVAGTGEPAYVASLRRRAERVGVAARVRWLGDLDEAGRRALFDDCDLLVFPSRHESFGLAVAEAMAAGRPVVVTPDLWWAAPIEEAGAGLVAAPEADAIARAVGALLPDRERRARLGTAGRALVDARYRWDRTAERLVALYREVAARG